MCGYILKNFNYILIKKKKNERKFMCEKKQEAGNRMT